LTLTEIQALYAPRVEKDLNLTLADIKGVWVPKSRIMESSARIIPSEKEARIQIDGNIAHKASINKAAFVLIVCHELGHIYKDRRGQAPLIKEGQADYFAPQCAMDYYNKIPTSILEAELPEFLKQECAKTSSNESCLQVSSGIVSFAKAFNVILNPLSEDSEEGDLVAHAALHPAASCRVKTLLAGLFHKEMPSCLSRCRITM
jgi:hypothetical protein